MVPNCANHHMIGPKKAVLFPEIGRVKFLDHSPARIFKCASIFNFKKQTSKKNKNTKEAKETKKKENSSGKSIKKTNLRPPGLRFFLSSAFPDTRVWNAIAMIKERHFIFPLILLHLGEGNFILSDPNFWQIKIILILS